MIDSNVIRHYFGHLTFFTLIINFILFISIYNLNSKIKEINLNVIEKTMSEYNEFDIEYICKITGCTKIQSDLLSTPVFPNKTYTLNGNDILHETEEIHSYFNFFGLEYDRNFNSIIRYDKMKLTLSLNDSGLFQEIKKIFYYINFIFIIVFTFMYFRNSFNEKKRSLLSLHDKETSIQEKYINLLNENINHELNTPMSVIDGKLLKTRHILENYLERHDMRTKELNDENREFSHLLDEDFPLIFLALDNIRTVMKRTSNWKQIKYSNGNTSIYDIIVNVKQSMTNFTKNIQYDIPSNLKMIVLDGSYKNGDLQLCLMNHIKNSAEAKATMMKFEYIYSLETKKMHLFVSDNGHGILDKHNRIISPSRYEKIFDPYYSTKDGDQCVRNNKILTWLCDFAEYLEGFMYFNETKKNIKQIRGIGTYLNRTTLRNTGGDLRIRETTKRGTTFEIITKAKAKLDCSIPQQQLYKR